jgi:hypothetical protein
LKISFLTIGKKHGGEEVLHEEVLRLNQSQLRELVLSLDGGSMNVATAKAFSDLPPIRFGRMYFREISGNGSDFGLPQGNPVPWPFRVSWQVRRFWLHITPLRRTSVRIL